jgi:hypothetical protein
VTKSLVLWPTITAIVASSFLSHVISSNSCVDWVGSIALMRLSVLS